MGVFMIKISQLTAVAGAATLIVGALLPLTNASGSSIPVMSDSSLVPTFTTVGGASVLTTTKTVAHFWSSSRNPTNGVNYGFNMVGANPANCAGADCSTTVHTDITPVNVVLDGFTFSGSDVVDATLASPIFHLNNYRSTPAATAAGSFPLAPAFIKGKGGPLLPAEKNTSLQLEDATMRAQFNEEGSSGYHVMLQPNVLPALTIDVPQNEGTVLQSGRGVIFADVNYSWWSARINNLNTSAIASDLPVYLTNNVVLYEGINPYNCCVIGFHGATSAVNGSGNQTVQTFAWASWVQPGFFSRANGGTDWALQDIHALSHEIAEWGDDPFVNNSVQPWLTPTAPQYGCTGVLETGDPVVGIGFAMGTNTFEQGPNPNSTQSADGYYHPEDEALLPWFMRLSPSTAAPTQSPSPSIGRYTLMGDLNPFPGFHAPATGC